MLLPFMIDIAELNLTLSRLPMQHEQVQVQSMAVFGVLLLFVHSLAFALWG